MAAAGGEKKKVALSSVAASAFLTGLKLVVGILTGSLGILSEALHSALDLVAAAITWFAVQMSDKPADKDHHYGHGKIENLSALIETVLLLITSAWVIYEAIRRLTSGETHIKVTIWSYFVIVTSIVIDISRSRALKKAAIKHNSQALEADALHFSTDIWSSGVVLLGIVCAQFGIFMADSIAAMGVALIVIYVSYRLGIRSVSVLLDTVPHDTNRRIIALLDSFKEVEHYHDLKVRAAGSEIFAEVNIHVRAELDTRYAHDIATKIEMMVAAEVPRCHLHVHIEPDDE